MLLYVFFGEDLRGGCFVNRFFDLTGQVNKTLFRPVSCALVTHMDDCVLVRILVTLYTCAVSSIELSLLSPCMNPSSWGFLCVIAIKWGKVSLVIFILPRDDVTAVDFAYFKIIVIVVLIITIKIFVSLGDHLWWCTGLVSR